MVSVLLIVVVVIILIHIALKVVKIVRVRSRNKVWKADVNVHGELLKVVPGLYRVEVKTGNLQSNMYIYQLAQKGLMVINPQVVNDSVLNEIQKLGQPRVCLIPNNDYCSLHVKDVAAWKNKFPECHFACPRSSYNQLVKEIPLVEFFDSTIETLIQFDGVKVIFPPFGGHELNLLLAIDSNNTDGSGTNPRVDDDPKGPQALIVGEILFGKDVNGTAIASQNSIGRLMGIFHFTQKKLGDYLRGVAEKYNVIAICPSHGPPQVDAANGVNAHIIEEANKIGGKKTEEKKKE